MSSTYFLVQPPPPHECPFLVGRDTGEKCLEIACFFTSSKKVHFLILYNKLSLKRLFVEKLWKGFSKKGKKPVESLFFLLPGRHTCDRRMGQKGEKEILTALRGAGRRWKEKAAAVKGNFLELGGRQTARSYHGGWGGKGGMLFFSVAGECWKRKVCVCSACLREIK